jgi:hypothetical protein
MTNKLSRRDAMKGSIGAAALATFGARVAVPAALSAAPATVMAGMAQAQAIASTPEVTMPATGVLMQPGYARAIAQMAYVWGWPMVNMLNRNAKITQAPYPGLLGGILPAAPRGQVGMLHDYTEPSETFVTCSN